MVLGKGSKEMLRLLPAIRVLLTDEKEGSRR